MRFFGNLFIVTAALASLSHAVELPCDHASYGSSGTTLLEVKGLVCYFYSKGFSVQTPGTVVTSYKDPVSGTTGRTNQRNDVKLLYAHTEHSMRYLPEGIEKFFPDLEVMYLYNVKIRSIAQSDLKPFPLLKGVYMYSSELFELDGDVFKYNPLITQVQFGNDAMTHIGDMLLDNLANFKTAAFGGCLGGVTYTGREKIAQFKLDVEAKCKNSSRDHEPYARKLKAKLETLEGNYAQVTSLLYMSSKKRIPEKNKETVDFSCFKFNKDTCGIENLKITSKHVTVTGVKDIQGKTTTTDDIFKVEIVDQQVLFMPAELTNVFPKMTELAIVKSGLFSFQLRDFDGMTLVTVMNFTGNNIQEIPSGIFSESPRLESLNLSHNAIVELEDGGFNGLGSLKVLSLENNLLTTMRDKIFEGLVSLTELTLRNNRLKYIGLAVLTPLEHMKLIDLKNNNCVDTDHPTQTLAEIQKIFLNKCIAPVALECWFKRVKIELSATKTISGYMCEAKDGFKIEHPKTSIFLSKSKHLPRYEDTSVTAFVVRSKSISYIPITIARAFPKLEALLVDDSEISSILKRDFEGFEHLSQIAFRGNNISVIEDEAFDDLLKLEYLDLSHNEITKLPDNIFANLPLLKTLILSSNPLKTLSYKILPQMSKLDEFTARNCELEVITSKILKSAKSAKIIDLGGNECIDSEYKKGSTKFMDFFNEVQINCCLEDCI